MNGIGLDCGNATLKLVLLSPEGKFLWEKTAFHYGAVVQSARRLLGALLAADPGACGCPVVITGNAGDRLKERCDALAVLGEIPAIHLGVRLLVPEARSVIEIGSQSARFLTGLDQNTPPRFAVNEHCAGGTGSFFEDQMSRLGLKLEDYSRLVGQARSIPRLSGRCAVFAKTDIIHRQQEGVPTPDILLGLCYAMVRNYKAVIVRGLPVEKPVALCGGVGHNQGVIQAVREVFGLSEAELILPEKFPYAGAVGAAEAAMETATCSMGELLASLCGGALEGGDHLCRQPALRVLPGTLPSVPAATGTIPPDGCVLGIDVGSTSTDLVLTGRDGTLIDYQYLRTAGDPEGAVRRGLDAIHERFGPVSFLAVGVTGSGRELIGRLIGADAVRDEITAQARAAVHWSPDVDTVFEIGGQDSKYISLRGGQVADFQMNRICAAGTGSFVEEQAARMGIPLEEFGPLALSAPGAVELGERCPVFIETALQSALSRGASQRWRPACAGPLSATTSTRSLGPSLSGAAWCFRAAWPTIPGSWPPFSRSWGSGSQFHPVSPSAAPMERPCWRWSRSAAHPASTDLTRRLGQGTPPDQGRRRTSPSTSGRGRCCWRGMIPSGSPGKRRWASPMRW